MTRVNILLPKQILKDVDRVAKEENLNRSLLLQKAAMQYLDGLKMAKDADERRRRMENAAVTMDTLAKKFGKWDGVGAIRRSRDQRAKAGR